MGGPPRLLSLVKLSDLKLAERNNGDIFQSPSWGDAHGRSFRWSRIISFSLIEHFKGVAGVSSLYWGQTAANCQGICPWCSWECCRHGVPAEFSALLCLSACTFCLVRCCLPAFGAGLASVFPQLAVSLLAQCSPSSLTQCCPLVLFSRSPALCDICLFRKIPFWQESPFTPLPLPFTLVKSRHFGLRVNFICLSFLNDRTERRGGPK